MGSGLQQDQDRALRAMRGSKGLKHYSKAHITAFILWDFGGFLRREGFTGSRGATDLEISWQVRGGFPCQQREWQNPFAIRPLGIRFPPNWGGCSKLLYVQTPEALEDLWLRLSIMLSFWVGDVSPKATMFNVCFQRGAQVSSADTVKGADYLARFVRQKPLQ